MRMISLKRRYVAGPESNQDPQSDSLSMLGTQLQSIHEPPHDKTNKMSIAPSEDKDQPVHPPSLIRVFAVRISYPLSALRRLIRLGGCPGWSESSLGTKVILLVLSWGNSHSESASISSLVVSEINHIFEGRALYRSDCSQGSLVRAPALPHTGYTCNLRRISHKIMYMVFLLFPLIQERQFLVISKSILVQSSDRSARIMSIFQET